MKETRADMQITGEEHGSISLISTWIMGAWRGADFQWASDFHQCDKTGQLSFEAFITTPEIETPKLLQR